MKIKNTYTLRSTVWVYPGMAGWHFLYVPKKESQSIKTIFGVLARGWGSLPIMVTIGKTTWKTSIFPDRKSQMYLLPLKAQVRKKESIVSGDIVKFIIEILV